MFEVYLGDGGFDYDLTCASGFGILTVDFDFRSEFKLHPFIVGL